MPATWPSSHSSYREAGLHTFRGTVDGKIAPVPRGSGGFGYDPLFYYPPFGATFAEVPAEQKWTVSHRGRAVEKMMTFLASSG